MSDEQEEILVQPGDQIYITTGEYKGVLAKVISPYTNSAAVEMEKLDEDGAKLRTVLRHSEYEIIEKAE